MLAEKLPKKIQPDFLNVLHINFGDDAVVWIITKQTGEKLVFFVQIVIFIAEGIFLFVRHYFDVGEREFKKTNKHNKINPRMIVGCFNERPHIGKLIK